MKIIVPVLALLAAASSANAALMFTNISVNGPAGLVGVPTITTSASNIDIAFNANAGVAGDPTGLYNPITPVVISYDVSSDAGPITGSVLSLLGAALGSGSVNVSTQIQSLPLPGSSIANNDLGYSAGNPPPVFTSILFSNGATSFRVTQTIFFSATDTAGLDLAQLSLVEHNFVPAPGALALMGMGGVLVARRRR
jgi:xanthosine utilization system XapX-like protein